MNNLPSPAQIAFGIFFTVILLWCLGAFSDVPPGFYLLFGGLLFVIVSIGTYIRRRENR